MGEIANPSASASQNLATLSARGQLNQHWFSGTGAVVSNPASWSSTTVGTASKPAYDPTTLAGAQSRGRRATNAAMNATAGITGPSLPAPSAATAYRRISGSTKGGGFQWNLRFCTFNNRDSASLFFAMATLTLDQTLNGVVKTRWPTYLGIGKDATDAELQWIARDNSGTVLSVPLGIGLAALQGKLLEMVMLCETGSDVAEARLINYDDDIEYTAQLAGASLPAADVRMVPVCYIGTGAVATSVEMDFIYQGLDIFMPNAS